jgi:hypothetical protein
MHLLPDAFSIDLPDRHRREKLSRVSRKENRHPQTPYMVVQPIIIQVLARKEYHAIRRRVRALALAATIFATLTTLVVWYEGQGLWGTVLTGLLTLLLLGNIVLLLRHNMIHRHSKSLCFDGGRCYTITKDFGIRNCSLARLHYRSESLLFRGAAVDEATTKETFAFQVLDFEDWRAIQALRIDQLRPQMHQLSLAVFANQ